ncbi:MAG: DUF6339 family protein [Chitinophagaceae bacterium]
MMKVTLFNNNTCQELLNYRTDSSIRDLYDNANEFNYEKAGLIADTIDIDISKKELDLGTKPGDDLDNSIKIYSALKHLDLVQANDKRLWVTLTHTLFYKYAMERWSLSESSSNDVIKDRFHFEGTGLRARNQNSIARLWWAAKITYDEKRKDPFELTKLLWEKQDLYQNLIDRKFSTYRGTLTGFLNFYSEHKYLDLKKDMRKLFKGINALGGVKILSLLEDSDVQKELHRLCKFNKIKLN